MQKYLIITGGSRGIGEQTILRFLQAGWHAVNLSRTPSSHAHVHNLSVDLTHLATINEHQNALQATLQDAEQICVVHNAAYFKPDSLDTMPLENLQHSLTMNIIAPVLLNQMLIPHMPAGSSIIYIGSTLAEKAVPGSASYIISKHGMVGLMKATGQDLISKKIHTLCINPGLVDTQLLKEAMPAEVVDHLLQNVIIGKRLIQPQEIADLIYFFANTNVVNGVSIAANTGQVPG